ncbi:hypothetical protein AnaeK_2095 [Anaeromyxobacter sp. K]|uniref:DMP19 family protein n=1 Tax=Anaeromyxobacter sp. (strain K) TaxID=447217 RepID=UPI00015F82EF|nr:DMP19 family protein [Anaeromyxobacter sp. K]ACG73323.1 hypothetical protein AnaeK_2095 [Anaeromyxobacter sp. K]
MRRTPEVVLAVALGLGLLLLPLPYRHPVAARSPHMAIQKPRSLDDIFKLRGEDFVAALEERTSLRADRVGFDELSPSEAALLDVWALEAEVNNGGFDQYFLNASGDRARGALAGLELIGAEKAAAITRRALAVFGPRGPAPSQEARQKQMDSWNPEVEATLEALDQEFYAYPDPLAELMERHCRAHREAFAR